MKIKQIDPEIIEAMSKVDYEFYEQPMLEAIRDLSLTGTAIDVGAHVGNHSVYFAKKCGFDNVIAFEPNPEAKHAFRENTFGMDNVILIGHPVTSAPCWCSIDINKEAPGQTKVKTGTGDLLSTSIDYFLQPAYAPKISLIKIDVEGMEIDVLKGAKQTIEKHKPHLFIEHFGDPKELLQYLPDGYVVGQRYNGAPTYHFYYSD